MSNTASEFKDEFMNSERQDDFENQISKTKTRICKLFDSVWNSNWRCGELLRVGEIPEVRRWRSDGSELERLKEMQND